METKALNKYDHSRLRGSLIRQLNVYKDGKVKVIAENLDSEIYYIDSKYIECSGDFILCEFQDDENINVSKY